MRKILAILFFCFLPLVVSDPCDRKTLPDPRSLRADQITVLINGYSESRLSLLRPIATAYSSSPSVAAVLILWGNPNTDPQTLTQFTTNLTSYFGGAPISIIRQSSDSLNARFLPRSSIKTRAVLICDDDVEIDPKSVEFAFKIWRSDQDSMIGIFARSHDLDLSRRSWMYTVHPEKYSIVLTKFMMLRTEYLFKYSCGGGSIEANSMNEMRNVVDEMRNCEDILMNFVVADETNSGPILVGAKRVRDWGDGRNEEERRKVVRDVGLSSRRGDHRKRRGDCIRKFHGVLGRMPLRYSYGKVVNSVGEQGLCKKGGKLVFCDQQILNPKMDINTPDERLSEVWLLIPKGQCDDRFVFGTLKNDRKATPRGTLEEEPMRWYNVLQDPGEGHETLTHKTIIEEEPTTVKFNGMEFMRQPCNNKKLAEKEATAETLQKLHVQHHRAYAWTRSLAKPTSCSLRF
ncbi:hypothetical protein HHK36_006480 [Tetracentron sinense]|uniref:Glycosyl transferase 64 domain-containing protein n=1 Tax=Tetracentron sinense TaxID=13715 RepID=A0A834ZJ30_TETSI|nr:hypothetical protein HHK36_006480 [Tetracentron sinense]